MYCTVWKVVPPHNFSGTELLGKLKEGGREQLRFKICKTFLVEDDDSLLFGEAPTRSLSPLQTTKRVVLSCRGVFRRKLRNRNVV
jgi:hypothetical protein